MKTHIQAFFTGALLTLLCIISLSAHAQSTDAGRVISVRGFVTVTDTQGNSRTLARGDTLSSGDLIETGSRSRLNILFTDGSTYVLRSATSFKIDEYVDAGQDNEDSRANFSIFRGALEAVSGWIGKGKSQNYRMNTPYATIGLRGTTFQIEIINNDDGTTEVRASTIEGAIVYSSLNSGSGPKAIPPGLVPSDDLTGVEVEVDDETGEVTSLILTAGQALSHPLTLAISRFAGTLFESQLDDTSDYGGENDEDDDELDGGSPI